MNSKRERIIRARGSHRNWLARFNGEGEADSKLIERVPELNEGSHAN